MTEEGNPTSCHRCGNPVQPGDRFCGECGARVAPVIPEDPQVIPEPVVAAQGAAVRDNRRMLFLAGAVGILFLLLVGGGALALIGSRLGADSTGGSDPEPVQPTPAQKATSSGQPTEEPEVASVSPDTPDPAFDMYLPALKAQTNAPIMLPAELPNEFENIGINANVEGDRYDVTFLTTPVEDFFGTWPRYKIVGTLMATPASEQTEDEYFEATSTETMELPDGTEATFSHMEPVGTPGAYGPYWKGEFEKDGYTYTISTFSDEVDEEAVKQVLATMVPVSGGTAETAEPSESADAEEVEEAAGDYYRAAGREDWQYTYENLDSETQGRFTREEWFKKNQWFANHGSVTYHVLSVDLDDASEESIATVRVRLTGEDDSSSIRTTYFVHEEGSWKHRFGQEEHDLFMPGSSIEEFLEAQRQR